MPEIPATPPPVPKIGQPETHAHNPVVRYFKLLGPGLVTGPAQRPPGAPPLVLVMLVGNNRAIMGPHTNGFWLNCFGRKASGLMTAAAVAFFVTLK